MIECRVIANSDIVEIIVDGYVTAGEYHAVAEKLLPLIEQHKQIRALKEVRSFTGIDFGIFKEKLIVAWLKHIKDVIAVALVCDQPWMEQLTNFLKPLYPYPVRCFKLAEIEEARVWLMSVKGKAAVGQA